MTFLEELAARRRFGMKPGLETVRALCSALDDPQSRFRAVHVAGTNGKGAVCAILDSALRAAGRRVGRYTSPHLVKLNERFFLDGSAADDAALERVSAAVSSAARAIGLEDLTFFEALTAVAFRLYAEAKVDFAVLECGLGGRLDATNICRPAISVITRIGLDHCDWLGDTVEKIAAEKAGIIRCGVPVVLGANEDAARAVVEARAKEVGAPFHYAPELVDAREVPDGFSLAGSFNRENALTALAALKVLGVEAKGFDSVSWPGRFQRVGRFVIDGAHNPPAARALVAALRAEFGDGRLSLVAGFCGDKDVETVLSTLAPLIGKGYAVKTNNPRSLSAETVAEKMAEAGIAAEPCRSLTEALAKTTGPTVVCGSLFLAGETLVELEAYPWGAVRFDAAESLVPR